MTPRIGKPVEVNALWYNALVAMAGFARALGRSPSAWAERAGRVGRSFARFWNFDAEPPHAPRGCVAQAWSVAETRAWQLLR